MLNLLLTLIAVLALGALALYTHAVMHRYGIVPLVTLVGALAVLLQLDFGIAFAPLAGLQMRVTATSIVPVLIMIVMVVYISSGGATTRLLIIAIFGVSLVALGFGFINALHMLSPDSIIRPLFDTSDLYGLNPITLIASLIAFTLDFALCTVGYQALRNRLPRLPGDLLIAAIFLAALAVDALFFRTIYDVGSPAFWPRLLGDLLGKWLGALPLIPLMIVYLRRVAPKLPGYVGAGPRPPLDLFAGSFTAIRDRLIQTERELHIAETERQQQATYLEQVVETANEALWLGDPHTNLPLYVNAAYLRIWGRSRDEFLASDQTFINTVIEEDRPRMPDFQRIAERGFIETEFRIRRPDGEIRWLRERAFAIQDPSGRIYRVGGVTEDITDRHAAQERQRELIVEREKLRVLRDVIADATHDLKAPLSSINLKIHALQRAASPDRQRQILIELEQITQRMAGLIDDVLTLARLENTEGSDRKPHDLNVIVAEVAQMMRPLAEARGIRLCVELPSDPRIQTVDRADLERALSNLIDNAIHYSRPEDGRITIRVGTDDEAHWVEVEDNGIGIPDEAIAHIFERFYRADNARSVDPGGTGLGLAIVHKIVEQHGGQITVTSRVNEGTTFRIRLPQHHLDKHSGAG